MRDSRGLDAVAEELGGLEDVDLVVEASLDKPRESEGAALDEDRLEPERGDMLDDLGERVWGGEVYGDLVGAGGFGRFVYEESRGNRSEEDLGVLRAAGMWVDDENAWGVACPVARVEAGVVGYDS